jgi:hypothetical protein
LDSSETGQCLRLNFDLITRMQKAANSLDPIACLCKEAPKPMAAQARLTPQRSAKMRGQRVIDAFNRLKALRTGNENTLYCINPAFIDDLMH